MESYNVPYGFYSDACLVFIITGIVCAIVRWAHMCRPYDKNPQYFYPARRQVTFYYAAAVLKLPYYLWPADEGVWNYIRIFGIVYYPVCFALLFSRYFKWERLFNLKNAIFLLLPTLYLTTVMTMATMGCRWMTQKTDLMLFVTAGISLLLSTRLFAIIHKLHNILTGYDKHYFADQENLPRRFASRIIWMPFAWIAITWCIFLTGSRMLNMYTDLAFSMWSVFFLCMILHPQRSLDSEGTSDRIQRIEKMEQEIINNELPDATHEPSPEELHYQQTAVRVTDIVKRRYKEKALSKTDILTEIGKADSQAANRYITETGFLNIVTPLRLEHARRYANAFPDAPLSEVASEAGFVSESALIQARQYARAQEEQTHDNGL